MNVRRMEFEYPWLTDGTHEDPATALLAGSKLIKEKMAEYKKELARHNRRREFYTALLGGFVGKKLRNVERVYVYGDYGSEWDYDPGEALFEVVSIADDGDLVLKVLDRDPYMYYDKEVSIDQFATEYEVINGDNE